MPPPFAERLLPRLGPDAHWRDAVSGEHARGIPRRWPRPAARAPACRWYSGARRCPWRHGSPPAASSFPRDHAAAWRLRTAVAEPSNAPRRSAPAVPCELRRSARAGGSPATSAAIVVTLAMALAANARRFAIMDALDLRPFRFPGLDRLILVASSDSRRPLRSRVGVSRRLRRLAARSRTADPAGGGRLVGREPLRHRHSGAGARIPRYRRLLQRAGAFAVLGRNFVADEEAPGRHRRAFSAIRSGRDSSPRIRPSSARRYGWTAALRSRWRPADRLRHPCGAQVWAPLAYSARNGRIASAGTWSSLAACGGTPMEQARAEIGGIAERLKPSSRRPTVPLPNTVVTFTEGCGIRRRPVHRDHAGGGLLRC